MIDLTTTCIICLKPLKKIGGSTVVEQEGHEPTKALICEGCFAPKTRNDQYAKIFAPTRNLERIRQGDFG